MHAVMDRDDLKRLLGPFPERCPLDAVRLETADCGSYVRETIEYAVETDERVKSFLLVPKHINRNVPAIFAHHQHASQFHLGKREVVGLEGDADQAYASELAERGYVVIFAHGCPETDPYCREATGTAQRRPQSLFASPMEAGI